MKLNKLVALTRRRILMNILTIMFGDFFHLLLFSRSSLYKKTHIE